MPKNYHSVVFRSFKGFKHQLSIFIFCLISALYLSGCAAFGANVPAALQVSTKPEATLFLNGKLLGKTPYFSDQLKSGIYTLKIATSDSTFATKVKLNPRTLTVVNRDLASDFLAQAGEVLSLNSGASGLSVISYPEGADLQIDGKQTGKTPILVSKITEGDHKVSLSLRGYITREFAVKIAKNFRLTAEVTLASELAKGTNTTQIPSPLPQAEKVEILKTSQGYIKVRAEPSIEASETGRVKSGSQYEVIQEIPDWVKINFDGKLGWISSQYTKKAEITN